jgi:Flp pilus assembly protein TadG
MSQRRRRERGAAAVEMALVLPLLIMLLGGIVDYGRYFWTQVQLTNAAREGARAGITGVTTAEVTARINTAAQPGLISGWQAPQLFGNCVSTPSGDYRVVTGATFRFFFAGVLPGVPTTTTIQSSATMGCV